LWWYMQGSIMDPDVRRRLRNAWGFCARHAWIALWVESSFRHSFLMGPAMVYEDIIEKAVRVIDTRGPMKNLQILAGLRERGNCLLCDMVSEENKRNNIRPDRVLRGQDRSELRRFARRTRGYWEQWACGRCSGDDTWVRCRLHLMEDARNGSISEITHHRSMLHELKKHITAYSNGFRWELRGTATAHDMAAMIGCVGWCSGWKPLFRILDHDEQTRND
ncbi:MAG TPA: hypothetical protein PK927_04680, partial [Smithellaceae bacterium]|nr:hypothetical protein [Smithellaceae bacterium]